MTQLRRDDALVKQPDGRLPAIGIVMPLSHKRGGAEHQLLNLLKANQLGPRIHFCVCFLSRGPMEAEVRALGYPVFTIDAGRLRDVVRYVNTCLRLRQWMTDFNVLYVISWLEKAHLYVKAATLGTGIPSAWWLRSIDPNGRLLRFIDRLGADHVLACSNAAAGLLRSGNSLDRMRVCHSGVDLIRFDPQAYPSSEQVRLELGLPVDRPIVTMVARLQAWKGIFVFLEAAAILLESPLKPFFLIVGGPHDHEPGVGEMVERRISKMGAGESIRAVGFQPNVPRWMQASDVIVHASIKPEPLGMVIVEAMAMGKPIIATRGGGTVEIVEDGVNGRLIPPGNADALAQAILEALRPSDLNDRMKAASLLRAKDFSFYRLAAEVEDFLASRLSVPLPRLHA